MFVRGDDMRITLRCVGCGKNPYNCPISQRPAWVSLVGSANSRPGSGIEYVTLFFLFFISWFENYLSTDRASGVGKDTNKWINLCEISTF